MHFIGSRFRLDFCGFCLFTLLNPLVFELAGTSPSGLISEALRSSLDPHPPPPRPMAASALVRGLKLPALTACHDRSKRA